MYNLTQHRTHKITNSYGIRDYYRDYYNNVSTRFTYNEYKKILYRILELHAINIGENLVDIKLNGLGRLYVVKLIPKDWTNRGELNSFPVDYNATMKLWEEDEEAKNNKTLIRHLNLSTNNYVFKIKYKRPDGNYIVNGFKNTLEFKVSRKIKLLLRDSIRSGKTNAIEI